jgi:hypothetical protein
MKTLFANIIWFLSTINNTIAYKLAGANVVKVQKKILFDTLRKNAGSAFGQKHNFANINTIKEWQESVPLSSYEDYEEYVEQIKKGQEKILTEDKIILLEPTSGSSGSNKLIPYTDDLQKQFQKAIDPWIFDLMTKHKGILSGKHYWSISPVTKVSVDSKLPVGFASDEEYLGTIAKHLLRAIRPVPNIVREIEDIESFYYVSLFFLLKEKNLVFISIWHPSWLIILLSKFDIYAKQLFQDIARGELNPPKPIKDSLKKELLYFIKPAQKRAEELEKIFNSDAQGALYQNIWPKLKVISSWSDKNTGSTNEQLKKIFPHVFFQDKGLIATEAIVSFPIINHLGKHLAINSHFFEFRQIEFDNIYSEHKKNKEILLAHQLKENSHYEVIITTFGGLYRYQLGDIIKVVGFKHDFPLIEFVGRSKAVSDVCGEKLNEIHVAGILREIFDEYNISPSFAMLAPNKENNKFFYTLFLEIDSSIQKSQDNLKNSLELKLKENYHYDNCIKLEQLEKSRIFIIKDNAHKVYLEKMNSLGINLGDIKPVSLSAYKKWKETFEGDYV